MASISPTLHSRSLPVPNPAGFGSVESKGALNKIPRSPSKKTFMRQQTDSLGPLILESFGMLKHELKVYPDLSNARSRQVLIKELQDKVKPVLDKVNGILTQAEAENKVAKVSPHRTPTETRKMWVQQDVHDLRKPLNVITGILSYLDQEEDRTESILTLRAAYLQLTDVLADIRGDLPKEGELGRDESFAIGDLENDVLPLLRTIKDQSKKDASKEIILNIEPSLRKQRLVGDQNKVRRVLLNLGSNAISFAEKTVVIGVTRADNGDLIFSVQDDGRGIPKDQQNKLFCAFSKLDQPEGEPQRESTGLGLSGSQRLVEMLGGKIGVNSNPATQKGTEFFFNLPSNKSGKHLSPPRLVSPIPVPARKTTSRLPAFNPIIDSPTILFADDDLLTKAMICASCLAFDLGYKPHIVSNGSEAVEAFEKHYYSVVVLDGQMPNQGDGVGAAAKIIGIWKKHYSERPTPVIYFMTGQPDEEMKFFATRSRGETLGKPVKVKDMIPQWKSAIETSNMISEWKSATHQKIETQESSKVKSLLQMLLSS